MEATLTPAAHVDLIEDTLRVRLSGDWRLEADRPEASDVARPLTGGAAARRIDFDATGLTDWDSSLLTFLDEIDRLAESAALEVDATGLPDGVRKLRALARAVPPREAEPPEKRPPAIDRLGARVQRAGGRFGDALTFLGEATLAFGRLLKGGGQFRRADLLELTQAAGASALGIVALVSFLLGLILAFVGAQQLEQFGATIYVADLVGVAMARDMAALMTAIVMAGRSGAAYAAQLGIMQTNQEVDALTTMGIRSADYLVLPRILALVAMMPFLVLFSIFLGILGGALAAVGLMDLSWTEYWIQTSGAVSVPDVAGGVFKGATYAALVALTGCYQGMRAERSSRGVGDAATSAVVTGIVAIIAACGLFQIVFDILGL
ncbi:MAG: ABC transporter permease [Gemmatimonadota bacterium]|nr:ABC transporter permease [Gemmatimonadota bacterium]